MSGIGWIEDLDARAACEAITAVRGKLLAAEADTLALAAHWADLHNGDAVDASGRVLPGMEITKRLVGRGRRGCGSSRPRSWPGCRGSRSSRRRT